MSVENAYVFVMSDGTGETVEALVKAVLIQFEGRPVKLIRYKAIRSVDQAVAIVEEASQRKALIVHTIVLKEVHEALIKKAQELQVPVLDFLTPILDRFSEFLGIKPMYKAGILHTVNEQYFKRIEAIEFTVKQDDGMNPEHLNRADIVLVGVSRTSKTPLSIFLSHRGWKVANYPLVMGIEPPQELFQTDQSKVVGLLIDPEVLQRIRRERLVRMGRSPIDDYASIDHIRQEIEWARELFKRNRKWAIFDVTNKAIEEVAGEIERKMQRTF